MGRTIEINSVQDFISQLESLDFENYYFRGEPSLNYPEIIASAFRPYPLLFSAESSTYIDYQEMLNEYYKEIAHELSDIERENFLHYSQHHGLPTPLVDITANPLTALFFSCSSNFEENTSRIHLFEKSKFIDFSQYINKEDLNLNNFFFDNEFTLQTYQKVSNLPEKVKEKLLYDCALNLNPSNAKNKELNDSKSIGKSPTATLGYILKELFRDGQSNAEEFSKDFIELFSNYYDYGFKFNSKEEKFRIWLSVKEEESFFQLHSPNYKSDRLALIIIYLIYEQSRNLIDDFRGRAFFGEAEQLKGSYSVVFPPIVMHPSVKFGRMKSQEGTFLYQLPHFKGNTRGYMGFSQIKGDIELIIKDKRRIYTTLNKMGINQKTIFPDHDNIATYLKIKQLM